MIDGHNLIPKVDGLSLAALDDETRLIELLQEFCRIRRKQVEVYFDNAPPGQPQRGVFGPVTAFFVREGRTADDAIAARLKRSGSATGPWSAPTAPYGLQRGRPRAR
jgi:predicted RNA-binding protein with PIN domain